MALKTKTLTTIGSKLHHNFKLTVTEDSTSVANNTSSVSWSFVIYPEVKGYDWVSNSGKVKYSVTINGKTYSGAIKKYDGKSTVTIKSSTETVTHNANGSKTLSYSFAITDSTGWSFAPGSCEADDTMALTAIPRQATITAAPNFNDEQNPTITYSNPAGSDVTTLELCIALDDTRTDALTYKSVSKTGTSYTYTLSDADRTFLRNATPDRNTLKVCFCLRTVIGKVEYFSEVWKTLTIVNAAPTVTPTVTDANAAITALTGGTALVRYCSNAEVTSGAQAIKGATIKSQRIQCGDAIIEEGSGTFEGVQSGTFTFTVTDSRGNSTTLPVQVPFVEYVKLSCSIGNNKPDTDGNFTLTASGVCYNGDITGAGPNALYVQCRYKVSGESYSDWMEMAVTRDGNAYTATVNFNGLDYRTTYIFQCKAGDLVDTVATEETAIKSMPVFDWSGEDFNFNVPVSMPALSIDGQACTDFVVAQGSEDGWYYQKFYSGFAKCWTHRTVEIPKLTEVGSIYASEYISIDYPFPFVDGASLYRYVTTANQGIFSGTIYGTSATSMQFRLHCATNKEGANATVMLYAAGFWK